MFCVACWLCVFCNLGSVPLCSVFSFSLSLSLSISLCCMSCCGLWIVRCCRLLLQAAAACCCCQQLSTPAGNSPVRRAAFPSCPLSLENKVDHLQWTEFCGEPCKQKGWTALKNWALGEPSHATPVLRVTGCYTEAEVVDAVADALTGRLQARLGVDLLARL